MKLHTKIILTCCVPTVHSTRNVYDTRYQNYYKLSQQIYRNTSNTRLLRTTQMVCNYNTDYYYYFFIFFITFLLSGTLCETVYRVLNFHIR